MKANDQNLLDDVDDARDLERFAARADGFTNKSGTWKLGHNGHNEECNGNGRRSCMCLSIVVCKIFLPPSAYRTKKWTHLGQNTFPGGRS